MKNLNISIWRLRSSVSIGLLCAWFLGASVLAGAANAQTLASVCQPGAKFEVSWHGQWYPARATGLPDAKGRCPISYEGYAASWDESVTADRIRAAGTRPANAVADAPAPARPTAPATAAGAVRDGRYSCGKIVGGGGEFRNFGTFTIRGGQLANSPLPKGWSVVSITKGPLNPRGVPIVNVLYRTASGNTDLLDCEPA